MSIRNKIVILFTAVTATIALLLSLFIYIFTGRFIESNYFQRMEVRAGVAGKAYLDANDHNVEFYNEIRQYHLQRLPNEKEYIYTLPIPDSITIPPEFIIDGLKERKVVSNKIKDNYYLSTLYTHNGEDYAVLVSAWNRQGSQLQANLLNNLIIGFVVSTGLVFILSLLLSKELISPIRHIIENARRISASNLHLRLQKKGKDEMADLTQTFNDMLDRLETAFETQSNFLNKAAHELRTPLTAIIGEAELALNKPRTQEEYSNALRVISREAEQLKHHTSSLLELAQAGYNTKEPFMTSLRMDELLFSVKRIIDFTDPANKVQMHLDQLPDIEDRLMISGNVNLLKLALVNIIQNACKYSDGGNVVVSLTADNTHCIVTVKDNGIGIPEKELKYIFDPFFRASNTSPYKGYGVGLPLAQKIIRLHRGELFYTSVQHAGTTVVIQFPLITS